MGCMLLRFGVGVCACFCVCCCDDKGDDRDEDNLGGVRACPFEKPFPVDDALVAGDGGIDDLGGLGGVFVVISQMSVLCFGLCCALGVRSHDGYCPTKQGKAME